MIDHNLPLIIPTDLYPPLLEEAFEQERVERELAQYDRHCRPTIGQMMGRAVLASVTSAVLMVDMLAAQTKSRLQVAGAPAVAPSHDLAPVYQGRHRRTLPPERLRQQASNSLRASSEWAGQLAQRLVSDAFNYKMGRRQQRAQYFVNRGLVDVAARRSYAKTFTEDSVYFR